MKEPTDNKQVTSDTESEKTKSFPFSDYFVSYEAYIIFVLLYTDGEKRAELLGITEELYESKDKAKKWKNPLLHKIHSDKCKHLSADEAASKINEIYSRMEKSAE